MRQTRNRTLAFETLEPRTLPTSLTVIVHGMELTGEIQPWVTDMARAVNANWIPKPLQCDDGKIQRSVIKYNGTADPTGCEHFILLDWAPVSVLFGIADEEAVAGALASFVRNRLPTYGTRDVHFIGHSRGSYVISSVIQRLGNDSRIGWLQMTTLDPRALGSDGILTVPAYVDWAENSYQTYRTPKGFYLAGALNLNLTETLTQWSGRAAPFAEHSEVHDWYHWSIDMDDSSAIPAYADPTLAAQQDLLIREEVQGSRATRDLLYGNPALMHDREGDLFLANARNASVLQHLGRMPAVMTDIAYAPPGRLYGVDFTSTLYRLTHRAAARIIGPLETRVNALTFLADGTLVAAGSPTDPQGPTLYTVDPRTGHAEAIGTLPSQYRSAGDLAVDRQGLLSLTTTNARLLRINLNARTFQDVGSTTFGDFFGLSTDLHDPLHGYRNTEKLYHIERGSGALEFLGIFLDGSVQGVYGASPLFQRAVTTTIPIVFRNGSWYLDTAGNAGKAEVIIQFGFQDDIPVIGDWDGNGFDELGVFRNGTWFFDLDHRGGASESALVFGVSGDVPIVGDWNRDGTDDLGVFRNGHWFFDLDGRGGVWEKELSFGLPGDLPLAGDWNGDGMDDIAVGRLSPTLPIPTFTWHFDLDGRGGNIERRLRFGVSGDRLLARDWDTDGIAEPTLFRPRTTSPSRWLVDGNRRGGRGEIAWGYGLGTDIPLAGRWEGAHAVAASSAASAVVANATVLPLPPASLPPSGIREAAAPLPTGSDHRLDPGTVVAPPPAARYVPPGCVHGAQRPDGDASRTMLTAALAEFVLLDDLLDLDALAEDILSDRPVRPPLGARS